MDHPHPIQATRSLPLGGVSRGFFVVLLVALAARLLLILFVAPTTDVYYYDTQAADSLLAGSNPYTHAFTGIPPRLMTTGAANVFSYLPFTAIYLVPFRILGDIRFGLILADLIIASTLYLSPGRWGKDSALVYLFMPFTIVFSTIYLNNSLISVLFLALFTYFEVGGRRDLSSASLGVSLASIQVVWIIIPIIVYYLLREKRIRNLAVVVGTSLLAILPLALLDPGSFLYDTLIFQFSRPVLNVVTITGPVNFTLESLLNVNLNLSLNGLLQTLTGLTVPIWLRVGALLVILPFFFRRIVGISRLLWACGSFLLVSLFVLPNDFFLPYFEMPFFLLLAALSTSPRERTT